jgi:cytochrome c oxidase cbb3-type subunit III
MTQKRDVDDVTGTETTGHVWDDDLKELNKPLPRWWLYTFYACIVWAVAYQIAYPAWPMINGYTKGMLGYSQRATVDSAIFESKMEQSKYLTTIGTEPVAPRSLPAIAADAMAAVPRALLDIPISTTTTGCGAAVSTKFSRP